MPQDYAIGVDIGGTKISFALITRSGELVFSYRLPTHATQGADVVFQQVANGIHYLQSAIDTPVAGIGIGCPGRLNPTTGLVYKATNLHWEKVDLKQGLHQYLKVVCPIIIQQDTNAFTIGEYLYGVAKDQANFVLMTIGTGLGGSALVDGKLIIGTAYSGMEIGHMPLDLQGRRCVCGMNGCPEMYVSGIGLLSAFQENKDDFPQSSLHTSKHVDVPAIIEAFHQQDALALKLIDELTDWLAKVFIICMSMLNPSLFVIGGGIGHALFDTIQDDLTHKLSHLNPDIHVPVPCLESKLSDSAIGAASLVWYGQFTE